jgi:hypothetical protein
MIYYFLLVAIIILSIFEYFFYGRKRDIKMLYLIAYYGVLLLLSMISGLRYATGLDQDAYINRFDNSLGGINFYGEYGYLLLNILFKKIFNNYFVMQYFVSLFCMFTVGSFLYKYSGRPFLSLLFYYCNYFFPFNMTAMRISIAFSIMCFGYRYIERRNVIKYFLITIIAMQFHVTAIIMLFFYYIYKYINKKTIFFWFFLSMFIFVFGRPIVWFILEIFEEIDFLPMRIKYLISLYLKSENTDPSRSRSGPRLILSCLLSLMTIIFHIKIKENKFAPGMIIGFLVSMIGFNFAILGRLSSYLYVSAGGLIAYNQLVYERNFYKYFQPLKIVMLLFLILYYSFTMIYFLSGKNYPFYFPYRSVLF